MVTVNFIKNENDILSNLEVTRLNSVLKTIITVVLCFALFFILRILPLPGNPYTGGLIWLILVSLIVYTASYVTVSGMFPHNKKVPGATETNKSRIVNIIERTFNLTVAALLLLFCWVWMREWFFMMVMMMILSFFVALTISIKNILFFNANKSRLTEKVTERKDFILSPKLNFVMVAVPYLLMISFWLFIPSLVALVYLFSPLFLMIILYLYAKNLYDQDK